MKRSVVSAVVAAAFLGVVAVDATAGWRSADRRQLEDEYVDEPDDYEVYQGHDDGHRDRDHHRDDVRRTQPFVGTQPYWGQMRPYWNSGEPPGVIHRQPRTAPLKIPRTK